jgi:hypothetical protein
MNNCQRCGKLIKECVSNSEKNKGRPYRGCGTKNCCFEWMDTGKKEEKQERPHRTFSELPPAFASAMSSRAEFNSPLLPYYTHREPSPERVSTAVTAATTVAVPEQPVDNKEQLVLSAIFKMVNAQVHEELETLKKQVAEEITKRDLQNSKMQQNIDFIAKFVGLEKAQESNKKQRL